MSTQAIIEDVDRPPAGTECCSCRAAGHFCPASQYVAQTDLGICDPCRAGEDCVVAKRLRGPGVDTVCLEAVPLPVSPCRTIPKEEWPADTAIHEKKHDLSEVPFGMRSEIRAEQNGASVPAWKREFLVKNFAGCEEFFTRLSGKLVTAVHDAAIRAVDPSWFVVEESAAGKKMLLDGPIFYPEREPARALAEKLSATWNDADFHLLIWHGGKKIPASDVSKPPAALAEPITLCRCGKSKGHKGRCPGFQNRDTAKREQAKELIVAGHSVRGAAEQVGLSQSTVSKAKLEIPPEKIPDKPIWRPDPRSKETDEKVTHAIEAGLDHLSDVAKAADVNVETARRSIKRNGGEINRAHVEGSMDQEVSVERRESVKVSTRTSPNFGANPVLVALLQYLPPPGEEFTINQRVKWLNAAISMFELLYTAPDSEDWMLGVSKHSLV